MIFTIHELAHIKLVIASIVLCLQDHAAAIAATSELHGTAFLQAVYAILMTMCLDLDKILNEISASPSSMLHYTYNFIEVQLKYLHRETVLITDSTVAQTKSEDIARCIRSAAGCIEMGTNVSIAQLEFDNEKLKCELNVRLAMAMAHHWHHRKADTVQDLSKKCWLGSLSEEVLLMVTHHLQ